MTTRRLCFPQNRNDLALREQLGGNVVFILLRSFLRSFEKKCTVPADDFIGLANYFTSEVRPSASRCVRASRLVFRFPVITWGISINQGEV